MGSINSEDNTSLLVSNSSKGDNKLECIWHDTPKDSFNLAFLIYFILGTGFLLPWNAFITAVDYFDFIYPDVPIDSLFGLVYMLSGLVCLLVLVVYFIASSESFRINLGMVLFTLLLLVVPIVDAVYVKGIPGMYSAFYVTAFAVGLCGVANALVQGGIIGAAGELPERYMQALVAGTTSSGVLVSAMRVFTKAIYPEDAYGLRKSANIYFVVSTVMMAICIFCYNTVDRLPVVQYYKEIKLQALEYENTKQITGSVWQSTLSEVVRKIKWHGFGIFLINFVSQSIFPGYITEDVHSEALKDWYPIILIVGFNVFGLAGNFLTAVYLPKNANVAVYGCMARLSFYPFFYGCLHGPQFFRTEIPVTILTCFLGVTDGYLTSVLMILTPKAVPLQHSEAVGIIVFLFMTTGLAAGSIVSWLWVL